MGKNGEVTQPRLCSLPCILPTPIPTPGVPQAGAGLLWDLPDYSGNRKIVPAQKSDDVRISYYEVKGETGNRGLLRWDNHIGFILKMAAMETRNMSEHIILYNYGEI